MKTIIVAVDFSPVTEKLLQTAKKMAGSETMVYIIHVAAPEPDFVGYSVGPEYIRQDRAKELHKEHKLLDDIKKDFSNSDINSEVLLISGPTVETLLHEIDKLKADLLIIGRKGHSKLFEVVIGSVCKDILNKLEIPALVVPVDEEA